MILNKKITILIVVITGFTSSVVAQISDKEAKKAQKAEKFEEQIQKIEELANDKQLILNVTSMQLNNKFQSNVIGPNFIKVDGNKIIIQTSNPQMIGNNGVGGMTIEGNITDYQVNAKKRWMGININFSSLTLGSSSINLVINADSKANAVLSTNFGKNATFNGEITPIDETQFVASSLY